MASTIVTKNSSTASAVPVSGDLTQGELAVNVTDKRLFTKNSGGTVVELGTNPASLALPNGTTNGVAYLNGSKVVTTGSALTFDGTSLFVGATSAAAGKLVVKDTASSNTLWLVGRTSDGASSVSFRNAADSAYNARLEAVSGQLAFEANGSEQMRLTSTGLGIGTSSPAYKLQVAGVISSNDTFRVSDGTTTTIMSIAGTGEGIVGTSSNHSLQLRTNNTAKATLDSSGNLGLGVTPSAWQSGRKAMQVGNASINSFANSQNQLGANFYYDGTNNKYISSDFSTVYQQLSGQHQWYNAPSGTAGNPITFTQAMTLDASGNLGIGTSSPGSRLEISASNPVFTIYNTNTGDNGITWESDAAAGASRASLFLNYANAELRMTAGAAGGSYFQSFYTNGAERMRLDSSGNLGLGVTPSAWGSSWKAIDVNTVGGVASTTGAFRLYANAYNDGGANKYKTTAAASMYSQDTGQHQWFNAASGTAGNAITFTQAMTLDASGNLNLGTTSSALQSGGTGVTLYGSSYSEIKFLNSSTGTSATDGTAFLTSSLDFIINNREAGAITFGTSNTERARIDSSGNLLIGTTSMSGGNARVYSQNANTDWSYASNQTGSGTFYHMAFRVAGTAVGSIDSTTTTTSYRTSSDYRLKNTVTPMIGALAKVAALKPVTYKWNVDGSEGQGFIAHELQEVVPDCVSGSKDAVDADGNPIYQGIDTSFLVATLTAAIQELKAEFDAYKATHP